MDEKRILVRIDREAQEAARFDDAASPIIVEIAAGGGSWPRDKILLRCVVPFRRWVCEDTEMGGGEDIVIEFCTGLDALEDKVWRPIEELPENYRALAFFALTKWIMRRICAAREAKHLPAIEAKVRAEYAAIEAIDQ